MASGTRGGTKKLEALVKPGKKSFDLEVVYDGCRKSLLEDGTVVVGEYLSAFRELCRFFKLTGRLFGFVAKDLESKISVIQRRAEAADSGHHYQTVQSMIEYERDRCMTGRSGSFPSGCRTIIRLQRALQFIIIFMGELKESSDDTKVSDVAWAVYKRTLSKYHVKVIRSMAYVAVHMLPTRRSMFELMCKQDPDDVVALLGDVIKAAQAVYDAVNALLETNNLSDIP